MQILTPGHHANGDEEPVRSLSFSADGRHLASATRMVTMLWEPSRGDGLDLPVAGMRMVGFAPRGTALAATCGRSLTLWPDPVQSSPPSSVLLGGSFAFRADGDVLACRSWWSYETVLFLDAESGEPAYLQEVLLPVGVDGLCWSPAVPLLAALGAYTSNASLVYRIDLEPEVVVREPLDLRTPGVALAFSPDGSTLAGATEKRIHRWDVATGAALPVLKGHRRMVNGIAYLPDGRLLSCSNDGTVRTWDHASGKCLDVRDWQLGELTALAAARDGMRAAVGCRAGTILIWDVE